MILKCLASGSSGNCYLLSAGEGVLILDCGVPIKEIKKGLNWDISKIAGVCVTHTHLDHSKSVKDFENMGIPVFNPYEIKTNTQNRWIGSFHVTAFDLPHNGTENRGFFIRTLDNQRILYLTDFEYCRYRFTEHKVNHILIECNYQKDFVDRDLPNFEHKVRGHCSLDTCKEFVKANATDSLRTVLLLHMGRDTLDYDYAVSEVKKVAGNAFVDYARAGETYSLDDNKNKCPF